MNKYEEALERIDMYDTDNVELHNTDEWALIKQAIAKAEKYDALFSKENGSLYDTFLDKVIEESDKHKKERDEALKDNAILTKLVWAKYGTSLGYDGATESVLKKYEDDLHKRIEELKEYKKKAMRMYKEEEQRADKLGNQTIALNHRIEELEKENAELLKANSYNNDITNKISAEKHKLELNYKVLVDGVKIVKKNVFIFGNDEDGYELCPKHEYDQCITNQEYKKYNAMLELVEVEDDTGTSNN